MYQKHSLCFVTAMFKICFAYIDGGGEINPVSMFGIFVCFYHCMGSYQLTEIIQDHAGIDFLKNAFILAAVPVYQSNCVFQLPETCFLTLYESSYKTSYTNPALIRTFIP